jgi:hypothetical protein
MLSHATAAWWLGLIEAQPRVIAVSTPRRCRSHPGIRVHQRRTVERTWYRRLPVTSLAQTLVDYATQAPRAKLRHALAQLDYHRGIDVAAIEAELRRGLTGSVKVRAALREHQTRLALTKSGLEIVFFELCEAGDLELPEINAKIVGWEVDALWRRERVPVEVDGPGNHRTPAQIRRDHRKDFDLRAAQITVLRYSDDQVKHLRPGVAAEIREALSLVQRRADPRGLTRPARSA